MATKTGNTTNNRLRGTAENDVLNGLGGNDVLYGLGGDDRLYGGDDRDVLVGGAGSDLLYGGAGNDVLIDRGDGGALRDYICTAGLATTYWLGKGTTGLMGARAQTSWWDLAGEVAANYNGSKAGVTVNLATGEAEGGDAEGDVLIGIARVVGSSYGDTLTGDEQDNFLRGKVGDDVLEGRGGEDYLWGAPGYDTASYAHSPGGVTVDLTLTGKQATANNHDAARDTLESIENLEGTDFRDHLTGDALANKLYGGEMLPPLVCPFPSLPTNQ